MHVKLILINDICPARVQCGDLRKEFCCLGCYFCLCVCSRDDFPVTLLLCGKKKGFEESSSEFCAVS